MGAGQGSSMHLPQSVAPGDCGGRAEPSPGGRGRRPFGSQTWGSGRVLKTVVFSVGAESSRTEHTCAPSTRVERAPPAPSRCPPRVPLRPQRPPLLAALPPPAFQGRRPPRPLPTREERRVRRARLLCHVGFAIPACPRVSSRGARSRRRGLPGRNASPTGSRRPPAQGRRDGAARNIPVRASSQRKK